MTWLTEIEISFSTSTGGWITNLSFLLKSERFNCDRGLELENPKPLWGQQCTAIIREDVRLMGCEKKKKSFKNYPLCQVGDSGKEKWQGIPNGSNLQNEEF